MTAADLLLKLETPEAAALLSRLYGEADAEKTRARLRKLVLSAAEAFPETASDLRVFSAPGRTELGGNHTDHNRGKVLAASIQLDALACVAARRDGTVVFRSTGYPDVVVDLGGLSPRAEETGKTEALVRGIAAEFEARGTPVRGFTAVADSTVLSGSGLSSSAAVEVLFGTIFDGLYGGGRRSAVEIAQIGQKAENVYFGKPCGLMDQVASASGGAVEVDFADPARPSVRRIGFDPEASGYALCVVDTGGSHADLTADYAAVPAEMKAAAGVFGKAVLREVDPAAFLARLPEVRSAAGDRAALRALHFFAENERVDAMAEALARAERAREDRDGAARDRAVEEYLSLAAASGSSSWRILQNVFAAAVPAEQGVSLALALTERFLAEGGGKGACRVHGGGFAGTVQAYVPLSRLAAYEERMRGVFGEKAVTVLRVRPVGAVEIVL